MSCVASFPFSIILKREPSELFGASRGLHQGDPLSPYLFIIMVEGLGIFIKFHIFQDLIHGWSWGNGVPRLSHLQFVDDTSLMRISQLCEAESFRRTLDIYLVALGQKVNEQKSSIYFFNTLEPIQ